VKASFFLRTNGTRAGCSWSRTADFCGDGEGVGQANLFYEADADLVGADLVRGFATWRFRYAIWLGMMMTSSQPSSPASLRTSRPSVWRGKSLRSSVLYSHSGIAPRPKRRTLRRCPGWKRAEVARKLGFRVSYKGVNFVLVLGQQGIDVPAGQQSGFSICDTTHLSEAVFVSIYSLR
jgi:hypothetical protein